MILSYAVYGIFIVLVLWGIKFAGFGNSYNEDFSSLHVTRSLRGLCALGIILHHISLQQAFRNTHELGIFSVSGIFFVSVFFFYSGYGLLKSIDTKPGYLENFIKSRILKALVVPFYVNILLYAVFFLSMGCEFPASKWICGILGITLLNEYAWYPIVLVILYLLFYVLFYNLRRREDAFYFVFLAIAAMVLVFCFAGHFPFNPKNSGWHIEVYNLPESRWWEGPMQFWFHGEWWINTPIVFLMGMIFANYEKNIVSWFKSFYWVKLIVTLVLFCLSSLIFFKVTAVHDYWSELIAGESGIMDRFIAFIVEEPMIILFMVLVVQVMMRFESVNPVTQFLGKHSLETYLMNYMAVYGLSFMIYDSQQIPIVKEGHLNLALYAGSVVVLTIVLGLAFRLLLKKLILRK